MRRTAPIRILLSVLPARSKYKRSTFLFGKAIGYLNISLLNVRLLLQWQLKSQLKSTLSSFSAEIWYSAAIFIGCASVFFVVAIYGWSSRIRNFKRLSDKIPLERSPYFYPHHSPFKIGIFHIAPSHPFSSFFPKFYLTTSYTLRIQRKHFVF
jgi:hypothetical protein